MWIDVTAVAGAAARGAERLRSHRRRLLHRAAHVACHCCGVALAAATRPAAPFLAPPPVCYVVAGVGVGQGCCHRFLPPFVLPRRRSFPPGPRRRRSGALPTLPSVFWR